MNLQQKRFFGLLGVGVLLMAAGFGLYALGASMAGGIVVLIGVLAGAAALLYREVFMG